MSMERFPKATRTPEVLVLRPEEPLLFANADPVLALARTEGAARARRQAGGPESRGIPGPRRLIASSASPNSARGWPKRHVELRLARLKDRARDALLRADLLQLPAPPRSNIRVSMMRCRATPLAASLRFERVFAVHPDAVAKRSRR